MFIETLHSNSPSVGRDAFTSLLPAFEVHLSFLLRLQRSFPYISAMVNNGTVTYDHGKDGRSSELGGCSAEIRNREHDTYLAIRYSKGRLTVRLTVSALLWWWWESSGPS